MSFKISLPLIERYTLKDNFSTTFRHKQLYAALKLLPEIGTMLCSAVNSTAMPYFAHSSHVFAFDCKFF